MRYFGSILIFWSFFSLCIEFQAEDPWSVNPQHPAFEEKRSQTSTESKVLNFYQNYISSFDGPTCSLSPTCSAYAVESVRRYGFWIGFVMTLDRLMHEANKMDYFYARQTRLGLRFDDFPKNNKPWWLK